MASSEPTLNDHKSPLRYRVSLVLLTLLAVMAGLLVSRLLIPRKTITIIHPDGREQHLDMGAVLQRPYLNLRSGKAGQIVRGAGRVLVVFISPGDCPNCLEERKVWDDLAQQYAPAGFQVMGIVTRGSQSEAEALLKGYQFSFPVFFDREQFLDNHLPQGLPFKVLVDGRGEPLFSDGPNSKRQEQERFRSSIQKILGRA